MRALSLVSKTVCSDRTDRTGHAVFLCVVYQRMMSNCQSGVNCTPLRKQSPHSAPRKIRSEIKSWIRFRPCILMALIIAASPDAKSCELGSHYVPSDSTHKKRFRLVISAVPGVRLPYQSRCTSNLKTYDVCRWVQTRSWKPHYSFVPITTFLLCHQKVGLWWAGARGCSGAGRDGPGEADSRERHGWGGTEKECSKAARSGSKVGWQEREREGACRRARAGRRAAAGGVSGRWAEHGRGAGAGAAGGPGSRGERLGRHGVGRHGSEQAGSGLGRDGVTGRGRRRGSPAGVARVERR